MNNNIESKQLTFWHLVWKKSAIFKNNLGIEFNNKYLSTKFCSWFRPNPLYEWVVGITYPKFVFQLSSKKLGYIVCEYVLLKFIWHIKRNEWITSPFSQIININIRLYFTWNKIKKAHCSEGCSSKWHFKRYDVAKLYYINFS